MIIYTNFPHLSTPIFNFFQKNFKNIYNSHIFPFLPSPPQQTFLFIPVTLPSQAPCRPSPGSDLMELRVCGVEGIEKEDENCERGMGAAKRDEIGCSTPDLKTHCAGKSSGFPGELRWFPFLRAHSMPQFRPLFLALRTADTKVHEVVRHAFRIALNTY